MSRETLVAMALAGGTGILVFLRLVQNEIALRLRAIQIQAERAAEARRSERKSAEDEAAAEIHDAETT